MEKEIGKNLVNTNKNASFLKEKKVQILHGRASLSRSFVQGKINIVK